MDIVLLYSATYSARQRAAYGQVDSYGGTCSVIWIESFRAGTAVGHLRRMLLWAWLVPVLMSGLIEILQANCTGGRRSGDWMDFLANSIGATLGLVFGLVLYKRLSRK